VPVSVDGSVTPDAIPDRVAYRHFIVAASLSNAQDTESLARQRAVVDSVGLSLADRASLQTVLNDVADKVRRIDPTSSAAAQKAARDEVLSAAEDQVRFALSPAGLTQLQSRIELMKRRIKIYGSVPR
jgi:hypothetical protein